MFTHSRICPPSAPSALRFGLVPLLWLSMVEQVSLAQTWPDEYRYGPFVYHADFDLMPLLPLLKSTSSLEQEVPMLLGLGQASEPIHVFLFQSKATYDSYLRRHFPDAPSRPALFVKQRGPGMVFARLGKSTPIDLRHETTHAVLHRALPMVPLWLDEGLGEYFEVAPEDRPRKHPHLKPVRQLARWGRAAKLENLERLSELSAMRASHYRDAWAWVHFMLHGPPEGRDCLRAYFRDIEARTPPGELSRRLKLRIPDLERQFVRHFRNWSP